ncbi:ParB/RepB/Spo0J family partition protein [Microbacterium xanthum]|uniref:ParB/RepB/Spo0J family partition protein n=1 Tax=Microbacterium xanthum TaxID=3079794 RepID=UPI002AD4A8A2|nr:MULTISPECIES: ParB/RepB/Spo0J family partition protein [unclassified Microbacterium]MDZ8173134.1 ParB/RepB/Spo0J family partition protein [Microbacterium sp. KSW-48]MDZ8200713.1 ParB/RepB/Spo0J family partition protein [Microbacterium sp. SSW1-59]
MPKRTGLGRGIGALIPTNEAVEDRPSDVFFPKSVADDVDGGASAPSDVSDGDSPAGDVADLVAVPGARLAHVDPHTIVPNPRQPRTHFDQEDLEELIHSVREFGVLQPVVVRDTGEGQYELIMGERRTRAARAAGLTSMPAIIRDTADEHLLRDALLENLHRSELNPLEEASAYQQLLDDFGITQEELATRIGRSRPQISNTIRLLKLPVPVQQRVAAGVLSAGHARAILSLDTPESMQKLSDKIVNEDLSVRAAEAAAKSTGPSSGTGTKPQAGARKAYLDEVAERLGDRLNTRVKVSLGMRKGQINIDFASIQDLNRILQDLGEDGFGTTP